MTHVRRQKAAIIARLKRLAASPDGARGKIKAGCEQLLSQLRQPVRVGIFGLSKAGKRDMLALLIGDAVLPLGTDVPTTHILHGSEARTRAMLHDGQTYEEAGYPSAGLLSEDPVLLTVTCPALEPDAEQYLLLACDDTAEDLSAGLNWAAARVDLVVWCSRAWTQMEADVLRAAPETLRDHVILCWTGPAGGSRGKLPTMEFLAAFERYDETCSPSALIGAVISDAVQQDILAAELFLMRYHRSGAHPDDIPGETPTRYSDAAPQPKSQADPQVIQLARAQTQERAAPEPRPSPEARKELAQLFRFVRDKAGALRAAIADPTKDVTEVLTAFEEVFETIGEYALQLEGIGETWPALQTACCDARDLALLLRLEGEKDQIGDAARLLLQLRYEMEAELAA